MSIPEYYLHLFCGSNGDNDQYSGTGRIAIAALMSGYGLTGSTKRDLQARVGWETTPGCFLGMKELRADGWGVSNRPALKFTIQLLEVKKAARTLNFTLNWNVFNADFPYHMRSYVWQVVARIYWLGRFMFGRNVIPEEIMALMKSKFNTGGPADETANLHNHYVMQFFTENGFFEGNLPRYIDGTLLPASETEATHGRQSRENLFLSLAMGLNPAENSVGFFASAASFPLRVPPLTSFRNLAPLFAPFDLGRGAQDRQHRIPQGGAYYDTFTVGTPSTSTLGTPNRMPSSPRDVVPLFFCDPMMTPLEEATAHHSPRMGSGAVNTEVIGASWATYVTATLLYEFHLLLTGRELYPLALLKSIREERGLQEETLIGHAPSLSLLSYRNSTLHRIVKFNLDRQNRV